MTLGTGACWDVVAGFYLRTLVGFVLVDGRKYMGVLTGAGYGFDLGKGWHLDAELDATAWGDILAVPLEAGWGYAMGSRRMGATGIMLLLAVALCSTCHNDEMSEASALHVFGTAGEPSEGSYSPPPLECVGGSGYCTDPSTGLEWQVAPTGGEMGSYRAKLHCSNLELDGGGWHLPDIGELRSLIRGCPGTELGSETCHIEPGGCLDSSCDTVPLCDYCYSDEGPAGGCFWPDEMEGECASYWSSSPVENDDDVWSVRFWDGVVDESYEHTAYFVRCVRSGDESPPADTYSPPEDTYSPPEDTYSPPENTWEDPTSGLTWQVTPTGGPMVWDDAKSHCSNLDLDGDGWRLPNIGELRSLIRGCQSTELGSETCQVEPGGCLDSSCNDDELCSSCSGAGGPGYDGCYWPDEIQGHCKYNWSSSPVENVDDFVWVVRFSFGRVVDGYVGPGTISNNTQVRCVR